MQLSRYGRAGQFLPPQLQREEDERRPRDNASSQVDLLNDIDIPWRDRIAGLPAGEASLRVTAGQGRVENDWGTAPNGLQGPAHRAPGAEDPALRSRQ
jgi:hypothetical protein